MGGGPPGAAGRARLVGKRSRQGSKKRHQGYLGLRTGGIAERRGAASGGVGHCPTAGGGGAPRPAASPAPAGTAPACGRMSAGSIPATTTGFFIASRPAKKPGP